MGSQTTVATSKGGHCVFTWRRETQCDGDAGCSETAGYE